MKVVIKDGTPVMVKRGEFPNKNFRIYSKTAKKDKVKKSHSFTRYERNQLTPKRREALRNFFSGMGKKDAGVKAGYSEGGAIQAVNKSLELAAGNQAFLRAMKEAGIDEEGLVKTLEGGLKATHPFKPDRKDWHAIFKFFNAAVKLKDGFPATKTKSEVEGRHIHVLLTAADAEAVRKFKEMDGDNAGEQGEHCIEVKPQS